jgi:hypothetical protein
MYGQSSSWFVNTPVAPDHSAVATVATVATVDRLTDDESSALEELDNDIAQAEQLTTLFKADRKGAVDLIMTMHGLNDTSNMTINGKFIIYTPSCYAWGGNGSTLTGPANGPIGYTY